MSLRNHIRIVRVMAAVLLLWIVFQAGRSLLEGDWISALAAAVSGLAWLALTVLLPLGNSAALSCPACGRSYGPAILLRMRCPHCRREVPAQATTPRGITAAFLLLLALVVGTVAYTWPMSFPALSAKGEVTATLVRELEPEIADSFVAIPQSETKRYTLTPGSPQAKEVAEILSQYMYRRCWKTLRGDQFVSGVGELGCYFYGTGFDLSLLGCRYVYVNGAVYQVGWAGDSTGAELTARVAAVLEGQNG